CARRSRAPAGGESSASVANTVSSEIVGGRIYWATPTRSATEQPPGPPRHAPPPARLDPARQQHRARLRHQGIWRPSERAEVDLHREGHRNLDHTGEHVAVAIDPTGRVERVGVDGRNAPNALLDPPVKE